VRIGVGIVIPLAAAVLQVTALRYLVAGEVTPDLVALVAVAWTLIAGPGEGIWWAFAGGLVADLLGGSALGATTVALLPVTLAFGLRDRSAGEPAVLPAAALIGLGAAAHQAVLAVVLLAVGRALPPFGLMVGLALGAGIYTGTLALVMYPVLRLLHRRTARGPAFEWK